MTRVGIRCDAGQTVGVGHLARCVALAEELLHRGVEPLFLGDLGGVQWAERQLSTRGLALRPAPSEPRRLADLAVAEGLAAVVLDGYELAPGTGHALRAAGVRVLALSDGDYGEQEADVVLDQNLGSEDRPAPEGAQLLGGVRYALLRDDVRSRRPADPPTARTTEPHRVLAFFGGTDAFGAAPVVVPLLLRAGLPLHVTVVAPRPDVAAALRALPLDAGQEIEVTGPVDDLAERAVAADLVLSASGTSTWELCCLGACIALVVVADNQELGYGRTLELGVAAGLGRLSDLRDGDGEDAVALLHRLLTRPAQRTALARAGWELVDGRGRERVADVLLA